MKRNNSLARIADSLERIAAVLERLVPAAAIPLDPPDTSGRVEIMPVGGEISGGPVSPFSIGDGEIRLVPDPTQPNVLKWKPGTSIFREYTESILGPEAAAAFFESAGRHAENAPEPP